jgi:hypothetical protein
MMKQRRILFVVLALGVCFALLGGWIASGHAQAQDTDTGQSLSLTEQSPQQPVPSSAFTYQGRLTDGGSPANDSYDLRFILYDAEVGGSQVGSIVGPENLPVDDGLFTAVLDFGSAAFTGDARWLEVGVRPWDSSGSYTTLSPRQELTPTPYALHARGAPWSGLSGVPAGLSDGDDDTTYSAGVGLSLVGTQFNVNFAGSGSSNDVARSDHNHLGQTWTGNDNPLMIEGSCGFSGYAPLQLSNSIGNGVLIRSVDDAGVRVDTAGWAGLHVEDARWRGVHIESSGDDGVWVREAGTPSTLIYSLNHDGFHIAGAEGNGLYVGRADNHGVHVESTGNDGVRVDEAYQDGVQVGNGTDFPLYGVYIAPPGTPYTAFWPNTANTNGEWALWTTDKIYAANVTASTLTLVAQVTGLDDLTAGDLVAVLGMADPLPDTLSALPSVGLANDTSHNGIIGVVESRMALQQAEGREEGVLTLRSVPGPARDGDYVALTVFGIAQVKVDARAAGITPGQRLTASDVAGQARGLRSETLNGMVVTEGAPVIGIALDVPTAERDTIPVFVTLR